MRGAAMATRCLATASDGGGWGVQAKDGRYIKANVPSMVDRVMHALKHPLPFNTLSTALTHDDKMELHRTQQFAVEVSCEPETQDIFHLVHL
jgi:hypothetical protein